MAEFFIDFAAGSASGAGTEADPWLLAPGQTGASSQPNYSIAAGSIYNIRNGTESNLSILVPANDLTYRGYGMAANVWAATLPVRGSPWLLNTVRKVRQAGTHEGMWRITITTNATKGINNGGNKSRVVIEDCHVTCPQYVSEGALPGSCFYGAGSTTTATDMTLRRCKATGGLYGYDGYLKNPTLEWFHSTDPGEEGVAILSQSSQTWNGGSPIDQAGNHNRLGSVDTMLGICIERPGRRPAPNGAGDGLELGAAQMIAGGPVHDSRMLARQDLDTIYVDLPADAPKQFLKCYDGTGGIRIRNFHFTGNGSNAGVLMAVVRGSISAKYGYVRNTFAGGLTAFRASAEWDTMPCMTTGSRINIEHVVHDTPNGVTGFFQWGGSGTTLGDIDGTVTLRNNVSIGANNAVSVLSYRGIYSAFEGSGGVLGANASMIVENNLVLAPGSAVPAVHLPTGGATNPSYVIRNNSFPPESGFDVGFVADGAPHTYTTLAAFQAAVTGASANMSKTAAETGVSLDNGFALTESSPLVAAGVHAGYRRDPRGTPLWMPPAIGLYEYVRPRPARTLP